MKIKWYIEANAASEKLCSSQTVCGTFHMLESQAEPIEFTAAEGDDSGNLKRFSMTGYTGGKMNVGLGMPVVVDLSGMKVSAKSRPILKDHNPAQVVGHTDSIKISSGSIKASGVVSGANAYADEVMNSSANGFPWQASIGASIERMVEVDRGETVAVNGRIFSGPLLVARKSTLKEISFVALGADDNTAARVAATNNTPLPETITMGFEAWLKAQGLDIESLSDEAVTNLKATYEKLQDTPDVKADADDADVQAGDDADAFDTKAAIAELRAEQSRLAEVQAKAEGHPDIAAKAISNGWSADRTELEVLRASRAAAPSVNVGAGRKGLDSDVVEAAICMAGGLKDVEKQFDDKTLQAAHDRYKGRIGLQEVFIDAAAANGYNGAPSFRRDHRGILQAAFSQGINASSGFSTLSITDILSNTANKFLLQGYNAVESTWREISTIRNVSDFKQVTSYNLVGDMEFEQVGAGGEIKHSTLSDESFTNKAETYAIMGGITRQDQINDDLGALTAVPQKIGRGAGLKANKVFWTEFLNNTSFFTTARNNRVTSNALSIDGLTAAELLFLDQKSPENADGKDGSPLGLMPEILLVPNALNVTASQLMNTTTVDVTTTANTPLPNSNPHAGKFRVVRSSYLNGGLGGASSESTWYLLGNPQNIPVIEVAALNGNPNPTVETADADFNTLGVQMRGYADFGVTKQNYLGGVKSEA